MTNSQRIALAIGTLVVLAITFLSPPRVVHTSGGLKVTLQECIADSRGSAAAAADCVKMSTVDAGLLLVYILVVLLTTSVAYFVLAPKKG